LLERWSRGRRRYAHTTARYRELRATRLTGWRAGIAALACLLPLACGFAIPAIVLFHMALNSTEPVTMTRLLHLIGNTIQIGIAASVVTVAAALLAIYAIKHDGRRLTRGLIHVALLGYATPGVIIAVGIVIVVGLADAAIADAAQALFSWKSGLLLAGTIAAVTYGCLVRFFAVAFGPAESGLSRIKRSLEDAARTLGTGPGGVLTRIHLPLMRASVLSALLLVFVEVLKELPATMILRPFNFDTLAIEAFQLATTERLDGAATPALIIVGVGLIPVILLCRTIRRSRPGRTA
jgi:iron(III) transport system permease protein